MGTVFSCYNYHNSELPEDSTTTDNMHLKRYHIGVDVENLNVLNQNIDDQKYQTLCISGENFLFPEFLISQYSFSSNLLGKGKFGRVFEIQSKFNQEVYALKRLVFENAARFTYFIKEINILYRLLGYGNIVQFVENYNDVSNNAIFIIMEKGDSTLKELMKTKLDGFEPELANQLLIDMVFALYYAHNEGVAHSDIKPDNILIFKGNRDQLLNISPSKEFKNLIFKLSDFGGGTIKIMHEETHLRGGMGFTRVYASPEVIKNDENEEFDEFIIFEKADIYALGITLLKCCGIKLINKIINDEEKHDKDMAETLEKLKPKYQEKFIELLRKMLCFDKNRRISLGEILKFLNVCLPPTSFTETRREKKEIRNVSLEKNLPAKMIATQMDFYDFNSLFEQIKKAASIR